DQPAGDGLPDRRGPVRGAHDAGQRPVLARPCAVIGRPDLVADSRFATARDRAAHSAECVAELDKVFAAEPLEHWRTVLAGQEGPWAVVTHAAEAMGDRQARVNGYVQGVGYGDGRSLPVIAAPVQFDETAPALRPAPENG